MYILNTTHRVKHNAHCVLCLTPEGEYVSQCHNNVARAHIVTKYSAQSAHCKDSVVTCHSSSLIVSISICVLMTHGSSF